MEDDGGAELLRGDQRTTNRTGERSRVKKRPSTKAEVSRRKVREDKLSIANLIRCL